MHCAARRRKRRCNVHVGWRKTPRRAVPIAAFQAAGHSAAWMSRPITLMRRSVALAGTVHAEALRRHRSSRLRTIAIFWTTRRRWILELDRGSKAFRGQGELLIVAGAEAIAIENRRETGIGESSEGAGARVGMGAQIVFASARQAKSNQARHPGGMKKWSPPTPRTRRPSQIEIFIPPGPHLGNLVIEAKNVATRATARTAALMENVNFSSCLPAGSLVSSGPTAQAKPPSSA